jgi:hypothetical protein
MGVVHVALFSWSIADAHATRRARPKRALAQEPPLFNRWSRGGTPGLGLPAGMRLERLCWNGLILLSDGLDGRWPAYPVPSFFRCPRAGYTLDFNTVSVDLNVLWVDI